LTLLLFSNLPIDLYNGYHKPCGAQERDAQLAISQPLEARWSGAGRLEAWPSLGSNGIFHTGVPVRKILVYRYVIFSYRYFPSVSVKLQNARSRLYRSQSLQVNTRWKALAEIYKIYMLLHRTDLNISAKLRRFFCVFNIRNAKKLDFFPISSWFWLIFMKNLFWILFGSQKCRKWRWKRKKSVVPWQRVFHGISYVRLGRHKSNLKVSTSRTADNKPCKTQPLHRDGRTRESEAVQPTVRGPAKRRLELDKAMMNPFTKKLKEQDAQLKCEKMREAETLPTTNTTRRRTSPKPTGWKFKKKFTRKKRLGWPLGSQKWLRSLPSHHNVWKGDDVTKREFLRKIICRNSPHLPKLN